MTQNVRIRIITAVGRNLVIQDGQSSPIMNGFAQNPILYLLTVLFRDLEMDGLFHEDPTGIACGFFKDDGIGYFPWESLDNVLHMIEQVGIFPHWA